MHFTFIHQTTVIGLHCFIKFHRASHLLQILVADQWTTTGIQVFFADISQFPIVFFEIITPYFLVNGHSATLD